MHSVATTTTSGKRVGDFFLLGNFATLYSDVHSHERIPEAAHPATTPVHPMDELSHCGG